MSTILTSAIVDSAKTSVDDYIATVGGLNEELKGVISTLVASNFNGDAANGYNEFFTAKVLPAITDNLIAPGNSLTASIKAMLDNIQQQLLASVDPQLGEMNRNPGGTPATN